MSEERKNFRAFLFYIGLTIILFVSGISLGVSMRTRMLVDNELLSRARTYTDTVILARQWNARYGGVMVAKTPGVERVPYLNTPDISCSDGMTYTKRNPATMAREMSEMIPENRDTHFRITSLKPVNPANSPDEFEERALGLMEAGKASELFEKTYIHGVRHFRYAAPLFVTESCLECHAAQGYRVGDIRGGISVQFEIGKVEDSLLMDFGLIAVFGLAAGGLLFGIIRCFADELFQKVEQSRAIIEKMAITDELTDIPNRRHVINHFAEQFNEARRNRNPLGCVLLDIDNFKNINDTYGHQTGDLVLRDFAVFVKTFLRSYDALGRYGGEEFLVILPETGLEESVKIAERIRQDVEEFLLVTAKASDIRLTISAGVAAMRNEDKSIDEILSRSDAALYRAKGKGRNRIEGD